MTRLIRFLIKNVISLVGKISDKKLLHIWKAHEIEIFCLVIPKLKNEI